MLTLLLLIVLGIVFALFATQNTGAVPLNVFNYQLQGVPLYLVALGSLLVGTFISWFVSLINGISSTLALQGKNSAIRHAHRTIEELKAENQRLALEIAELKGTNRTELHHDHNETVDLHEHSDPHPSFLHRLRRNWS